MPKSRPSAPIRDSASDWWNAPPLILSGPLSKEFSASIMEAWTNYCKPPKAENIVQIDQPETGRIAVDLRSAIRTASDDPIAAPSIAWVQPAGNRES
jgi:hypothetical protein